MKSTRLEADMENSSLGLQQQPESCNRPVLSILPNQKQRKPSSIILVPTSCILQDRSLKFALNWQAYPKELFIVIEAWHPLRPPSTGHRARPVPKGKPGRICPRDGPALGYLEPQGRTFTTAHHKGFRCPIFVVSDSRLHSLNML